MKNNHNLNNIDIINHDFGLIFNDSIGWISCFKKEITRAHNFNLIFVRYQKSNSAHISVATIICIKRELLGDSVSALNSGSRGQGSGPGRVSV